MKAFLFPFKSADDTQANARCHWQILLRTVGAAAPAETAVAVVSFVSLRQIISGFSQFINRLKAEANRRRRKAIGVRREFCSVRCRGL